MKGKFYESSSLDPYENLATEQYLAEKYNESYTLYFWKNADCVVCGRNQNVAMECNLAYMQNSNIIPVRRFTGGGAVFQDIGNLNFTFIVPHNVYDRNHSMNIVSKALCSIGIKADVNGRNDILIDGFKISGSAYSSSKNAKIHHGTILIDVDMKKLALSLQVSKKKLDAKGIKSVKSRVANIKDFYPNTTEYEIRSAIKRTFIEEYELENLDNIESMDVSVLSEKLKSIEWIFGYDKEMIVERSAKFDWGEVKICYHPDGYIRLYSDAIDTEAVCNIENYISTRTRTNEKYNELYNDIDTLF